MSEPILVPVVPGSYRGSFLDGSSKLGDLKFLAYATLSPESREARLMELGLAADALDGATRACAYVPSKGDTTDYEARRVAAERRFYAALNALHPPAQSAPSPAVGDGKEEG